MPRRSDCELLNLARSGDSDAFGTLFVKHRDSAYRVAYALSQDHAAAEDAVSETFAAILSALRSGRGPQGVFLPYLLSSVSRTVWRNTRKKRRELPSEDMSALEELPDTTDRVVAAFENESARRALEALPERWRMVIWYLDIENFRPRDIAAALDLSPNAVVALHRRAKSALRVAYLTEQLGKDGRDECPYILKYVPAYLSGTLSDRRKIWYDDHLETCAHCRKAFVEILDSGIFRVPPENRPPGWPWKNFLVTCGTWALVAMSAWACVSVVGSGCWQCFGPYTTHGLNRISVTVAGQLTFIRG